MAEKEKAPVHLCNMCRNYKACPDQVPCKKCHNSNMWKPCSEKEHKRRVAEYARIEKRFFAQQAKQNKKEKKDA